MSREKLTEISDKVWSSKRKHGYVENTGMENVYKKSISVFPTDHFGKTQCINKNMNIGRTGFADSMKF